MGAAWPSHPSAGPIPRRRPWLPPRPPSWGRGALAAGLVLLAFALLTPAGPAQAQQPITGLTVTPIPGGLAVSWNPYPGATYYSAFAIHKEPGGDDQVIASCRGCTGTSQTFARMPPGRTYTVSVSVVTRPDPDSQWIPTSGTTTQKTNLAPLPATLTVSDVTATTATLTTNARGAWWYKQTSPTDGACSSQGPAGTIAVPSGLTPVTSYTYKAYFRETCVDFWEFASVTFRTLPAPPTGVTVTSASPTSLKVSWNPSPSETCFYQVQWKSGSQQYDSMRTASVRRGSANNKCTSSFSHTIADLTEGTTYTVRVIATTAFSSNDGTPSGEVTGTPQSGLTATSISALGATLTLSTTSATGWWYRQTWPQRGACTAAPSLFPSVS